MVVKSKPMNRVGGIASAVVSANFGVGYVFDKQVTLFSKSVNAAGPGAFAFIPASIVLFVGTLKYQVPASGDEMAPTEGSHSALYRNALFEITASSRS